MALQGAQHQARVCRVLGVLRHAGHSGAACAQHVRHARMHSMRAMPSAHLVVVVIQRTSHQLHHAVPQVGALRAKLGQAGQGGGADLQAGPDGGADQARRVVGMPGTDGTAEAQFRKRCGWLGLPFPPLPCPARQQQLPGEAA